MKGYKSKDDISAQMMRIFKNYPEHRHYNLAQSLALKYNYNMSMTERNKELHRLYMETKSPLGLTMPGYEKLSEHYLNAMGSELYPREIYTK